jgi:hypothetical protein
MAQSKRNPGFQPHIDARQVEAQHIRQQEQQRIKRMILEEADMLRRQYHSLPVDTTVVPLEAFLASLDSLYDRI